MGRHVGQWKIVEEYQDDDDDDADDDDDGEDKSKKHGQSLMKLNTYKAICFVQTRWARALASLSVYSTIR